MPNDTRELLLALMRSVHDLRSAHEALLRTVCESQPKPTMGKALLKQYRAYKVKFSEDALIALEKQFPDLAAELDDRPPLPPADDMN